MKKIAIILIIFFNTLIFALPIDNKYKLTSDEQQWIDKKIPITYVYDIDWAPFEWKNNVNTHSGIIADILDIISKKSNIKFEAIHTNSWEKAVLLAKNNKVDMYSAIPYDSQRAKYMDFSTFDIFNYNACLMKNINDDIDYSNLNNIGSNKTIAIVKSSSLGKYIKNKYPNAKYIEVDKTTDGFKKLQNRKIDLFAINSATAEYMINVKGYKDLEIVTKLDYIFKLKIAISNTMDKEALSIINKILSQIDKKEINNIYNKWMKPVVKENEINWKIIITIIIILLIIILFILYRQNLLSKHQKILENTIKKKTKDLNDLNKNLENIVKEKTKQQSHLLSLFDEGDSVLFQWKNNEGWSVEYASKSVSRLLGYRHEDFLNKSITYISCIHKNDVEIVSKEVDNASKIISNDFFKHQPYRIITKNGDIKWVLDHTIIVRDKNNNIKHYIGHISDITDLRKKEEMMIKSEKLASMGEMIGNIAHQWRQPLSVISTASSGIQLQKEHGMLTDELLESSCNAINSNALYLSNTIDDFKNFIKGDGTKQLFNIKDTIDSFLNLIDGSIKSNNINIILSLKKDIKIDGYENEIKQCLINIFNNAKDILIEKEIEDKYIFISTIKDDNNVIIKIKDNAGGISKEIINKIFEPYFTTKHQSQGTGLGLHMTYNLIVDGMGGTIEADNVTFEYDGIIYDGAEFTISLPMS